MEIRKFTWLSTLIGSLATIAVATVTYFSPENATAINASIVIASTAITNIMEQFINKDE